MKNQNLLGFGMIAAAIVAGGALVGRAGDVNPPAGPVQGTMHTLEEIYAKIAQGTVAGSAGRWRYHYVPAGSDTTPILVASSPGVLRGVMMTTLGNYFQLIDSNTTGSGTPVIAEMVYNSDDVGFASPSVTVPLDVEFQNGLVFKRIGGQTSATTIIYRVD